LISRRLPSEGKYLLVRADFRRGCGGDSHRRLSPAEGCRVACGLLGRATVSGGAVPLLLVHM